MTLYYSLFSHMNNPITVAHIFTTTRARAWEVLTRPEHIVKWNHASDDWCCPHAENDVRVGGRFSSRMEARDGSMGFDFGGTYTAVTPEELYAYTMDDGRQAQVTLRDVEGGVEVTTAFEAEGENSRELQEGGWSAILASAKRYAEALESHV
jgi:uncharacterized protein YndB with AHSA1/START domain